VCKKREKGFSDCKRAQVILRRQHTENKLPYKVSRDNVVTEMMGSGQCPENVDEFVLAFEHCIVWCMFWTFDALFNLGEH
jgi:hypothetical protein